MTRKQRLLYTTCLFQMLNDGEKTLKNIDEYVTKLTLPHGKTSPTLVYKRVYSLIVLKTLVRKKLVKVTIKSSHWREIKFKFTLQGLWAFHSFTERGLEPAYYPKEVKANKLTCCFLIN
jgi:hypothetical protein